MDLKTEDGTKPTKEKVSVLELWDIPPTCTRDPGHYNKDPMTKYMRHLSVSEMAIRFWCSSLQLQAHFEKIY